MDVSQLYRSAAQIDEAAALLRARVALLALGAATTRWYSPAARTYVDNIDEVVAQLSACAARTTRLADNVRSYAIRVQRDGP